MYLARFEASGEEWIQATALIDVDGAGLVAHTPTWDLVTGQLSAAARIPHATVAYRVTLGRARKLNQTIAITATSGHESDIRAVIARLTRIERMRGGTLSIPLERQERDDWMERLGAFRLSSTADSYSVGGIPLACNFRLSEALDDLLTTACLADDEIAYQIHLRAADVFPEWVRSARKNMLALREIPGVRQNLAEWQEELARALGHASAFCEEYLAVDNEATARSIEHLLADRFRAKYGALGFPPANLRFERNAYQDLLVAGIHSHDLEPFSPVALCSVAEPAKERDRLLAWEPSSRLVTLLARADVAHADDTETIAAQPTSREPLPQAYDGGGPAVFVSYRHQDIPRVSPIIRMLQALGIPVWYDRGIPGGSEWDEVIEKRLSQAPLVVVCASQAAIDSKYVRREVKFADALGVRILPVLLEDVVLRHGMGMLLTEQQRLDARAVDFGETLRVAVASVR
jgi:TIR domain